MQPPDASKPVDLADLFGKLVLLPVLLAGGVGFIILVEYLAATFLGHGALTVAAIAAAIVLAIGAMAADRHRRVLLAGSALSLRGAGRCAPGDKAWLRGNVKCDAPFVAPHFDLPCAYYDYRAVEVTYSSEHGWKDRILEDERKVAPFRIADDTGSLAVDADDAEFHGVELKGDTVEYINYSLKYLPAIGPVSAFGVVSADGTRLERAQDLPLMVTLLTLEQWQDYQRDFAPRMLRITLVTAAVAIALLTLSVLVAVGVLDHPMRSGWGYAIGPCVAGFASGMLVWAGQARRQQAATDGRP